MFLFQRAGEKIDGFIADENYRIIIGGEFNVVNNPDLDSSGGIEVEETNIKTAIRTDHLAITISFNSVDEQMRGPSYWKFNSSLVDDETMS